MEYNTDKLLIKRFKDGDGSAFRELVQRYQDKIYNLCRYMIADANLAQDAAQDTFVKAYKALNIYKPDFEFYTWLYRIAVNTCLDYRKKLKTTIPAEYEGVLDEIASPEPSPEHLYQSKETGALIQAALARLPEKLRAVIVLKELEELSYDEIAQVLDVSIGTVKSRISRAREELRRLLRKKL